MQKVILKYKWSPNPKGYSHIIHFLIILFFHFFSFLFSPWVYLDLSARNPWSLSTFTVSTWYKSFNPSRRLFSKESYRFRSEFWWYLQGFPKQSNHAIRFDWFEVRPNDRNQAGLHPFGFKQTNDSVALFWCEDHEGSICFQSRFKELVVCLDRAWAWNVKGINVYIVQLSLLHSMWLNRGVSTLKILIPLPACD